MRHDRTRVIVIDTETTGLHVDAGDELLQISIVDGRGKKLLNVYTKLKYKTEWPEAQAVNGITPEKVAHCMSASFYKTKIEKIMKRASVIISYNGDFDFNFLEKNAGVKIPTDKKFLDVMFDFAETYGEWNDYKQSYRWQKLGTAANYVGFTFKAHDSLEDCLATLAVAEFIYSKNSRFYCL